MAKKLIISLAVIILSFCCSVCFAADNDSNVNLGEEITDSLNKTGDSVRNVANDAMNRVDSNNKNMRRNENGREFTDNNIVSDSYNAVRTSVDDMTTGTMSTTTWIWIILAVAAIIIVAMVWYYAVQNNNDE